MVGPDPEALAFILQESVDEIVAEARGVAAVEGGEARTVETHDAVLRGQPEVAVVGLDDGLGPMLAQAVPGAPGVQDVLGEGLVAIQSPGRTRQAETQEEPPGPRRRPSYSWR